MKTPSFLRSGLFFLAGFAVIPAFAADEFRHAFITHVLTVKDDGGNKLFAAGDTRLSVLGRLGQPHGVLSQNVWLYRDFAAQNNTDAAKHFCDNLVFSFVPGAKYNDQKVGAIVLANAEGLKKIEKGVKQNPRYLEDLLTGY